GRGFGVLLVLACAFALSTRPAAAPAWTILQSPNFIVLGDAGERSLRDVALRLEQFRAVIGRLVPRAKLSASVPTIVVVFGSDKTYEPFRPRYPRAHSRAPRAIHPTQRAHDGRPLLPAVQRRRPAIDLLRRIVGTHSLFADGGA